MKNDQNSCEKTAEYLKVEGTSFGYDFGKQYDIGRACVFMASARNMARVKMQFYNKTIAKLYPNNEKGKKYGLILDFLVENIMNLDPREVSAQRFELGAANILGLFNMIQGIEDEIIEMMKGKKSK